MKRDVSRPMRESRAAATAEGQPGRSARTDWLRTAGVRAVITFPVGGQQSHDHRDRQGKRREPAGSVAAAAVFPGPRRQHHRPVRRQAGRGRAGPPGPGTAAGPAAASPPQPAAAVSDEVIVHREPNRPPPASRARAPGCSGGRCHRRQPGRGAASRPGLVTPAAVRLAGQRRARPGTGPEDSGSSGTPEGHQRSTMPPAPTRKSPRSRGGALGHRHVPLERVDCAIDSLRAG